jgi:methylmalonyl-CoA mutase cobalamin-binding subunit
MCSLWAEVAEAVVATMDEPTLLVVVVGLSVHKPHTFFLQELIRSPLAVVGPQTLMEESARLVC